MKWNENECNLELWDTAGQESYGAIRSMSYPGTDLFLVCFAVDDPDSLKNVGTKWLPDLKDFKVDKTPCYLIGLKTDLRDGEEGKKKKKKDVVAAEMGLKMKKQFKNVIEYQECSAKEYTGVDMIFKKAFLFLVKNSLLKDKKSSKIKKKSGGGLFGFFNSGNDDKQSLLMKKKSALSSLNL